ncbi:MAG TPA: DivIVA domain-containing protein [Acidimicrobiales bacterium]|nr:DivIVA domain-containing protein [Acidimicrobiales bacterium]
MSPEPPLDATGIARRQFSTSRKGYDPAEVRAFLHELSDMVGRLQRGESHERDRAERAEQRAKLAEQLDEHRLVELLGEETARVLDAARAAAADIRTHAEESAARLVREAQTEARAISEQAELDAAARRAELLAEADALRREAEDEVERRRVEGKILADDMRRVAEQERERMLSEGERARAEAEAAAEQIRASAREQGRHLVGEAQVVRERMLGDLSRRRRVAREQLERLNGARERLLAAYAVVKRTVEEATTELTVALPEARAASEQAMRRVSDEPEDSVEVIEAELSVARMGGLDSDVASATVSDEELDEMLRELAEEEAARAAAAAAEAEAERARAEAESAAEGTAESTAEGVEGATAGSATAGPDDPAVAGRVQPTAPPSAAEADASGRAAAETDAAAPSTAEADASDRAAAPSPPAPPGDMSDGDKWGIRLPRPRPGAPAGVPAGQDVPEPVAAAASGDVAPAAEDEGESGPYVDELFARIRAEGRSGEAPDAAGAAPAPHDESGAVAVAERPGPATATPVAPSGGQHAKDGRQAGPTAPAGSARVADAHADLEPESDDAVDDEPVDPATRLLRARDVQLATVERELGRRLKRVLADEQNEVLDRLRRGGTVVFADLVPAADEHVDQFAIAATEHLEAAAAQGAELVGATATPSCDALAATLGRTLVEPLRVRIERSFDDSDGDLEEVGERLRALYREWKGNHIGNAVRHFTATAHARGAYGAAPAGTALHWLVDRSCDACPDCDDNALAGGVVKGEAYPTGDRCAPAHPDCRCLVVPADLLHD